MPFSARRSAETARPNGPDHYPPPAPGPRLGSGPAAIDGPLATVLRAFATEMTGAAAPSVAYDPAAMAEAASVLWTRLLRFDAADPAWPDRDRFVFLAADGAPLLRSLLRLTGHVGEAGARELAAPLDPAPNGSAPAIAETPVGPDCQGLGTAVGMALAERMMAARFGRSLVDHRTWVIAPGEELMRGASLEVAAIAAQLRLDRLTVLYEDRAPSDADGLGHGDVRARFAAEGWATKLVPAHDTSAIYAALSGAMRSRKPMLIGCRVDPAHAPDTAPSFTAVEAPGPLLALWRAAGARVAAARRGWLKRIARHPMRAEFERTLAGRLQDDCHAALATLRAAAEPSCAERVLATLAAAMPELVGGSTVGRGTTPPLSLPSLSRVAPGAYGGRLVAFGPRAHAMADCLNGLAVHGGIVPCGAADLSASDVLRPALLAAGAGRLRVVHVLTEDDEAPEPEQLAALRTIPNLTVLRPADAVEMAECWDLALRRINGPTALVVPPDPAEPLRVETSENRSARGGYVLAEAEGARQATLIATGREVAAALAARALLAAEGIAVAIVSLPCWALFEQSDASYRAAVLGGAPRFGVEAGCGFGWERWLGPDGPFIGIGRDAAGVRFRRRGLSPDAIAAVVRRRIGSQAGVVTP
jgi:transketolase